MTSQAPLSPMAQVFAADPAGRLGPWLVGTLADFMLQGVIFLQMSIYWNKFSQDPRSNKAFVALLGVANVLKTAQSFYIVWQLFIVGFGNWNSASSPCWQEHTETLTTAVIGFLVQGFFVARVMRLLKRAYVYYVVAAIVSNMILGLAGAIALTVVIMNVSPEYQADFNVPATIMLVGTFVADVLITGSILWHFFQLKTGFQADIVVISKHRGSGQVEDIMSRTNSLLNRIVKITWLSALPPTCSAILHLAFYLGTSNQNSIFIAWNMALPKLYTISMLVVLLSRTSQPHHSPDPSFPGGDSTGDGGNGTTPDFALSDRSQVTFQSGFLAGATDSPCPMERSDAQMGEKRTSDNCPNLSWGTTSEKPSAV